ncbi:class I adenylate-forming enzyme family protein [Cryptosporangium aurantiacum]|uniref:Acyl-CoA synthetase (AMP-forming)/AMP-acid ligase II n=1 Tax=Cryptosporangium aurantiacum TaxID=134849 RepID=A0A1M7TYR7_9ACTN|nr:class I adenylate-forming enzyme family protein [Cryptosporangium aurantiacum]SHN75881.1 Acyl-CoA synthetase (AMP-forming)/AMP-acid ligase II [Cryptosporangium aurantiacum]
MPAAEAPWAARAGAGPGGERTVPAVLRTRLRLDAAREAVVDDERSVTYAELDDASRTLATALVAAGVRKGSRVGLLAPNGVDWVVAAVAVTRIGAVLVPLSTLLRPPELLAQLREASVSHLIAVPAFRNRRYLDELEEAAPGLTGGRRHVGVPHLRAVWSTEALPGAAAPAGVRAALEDAVRPADDLVILFTSGSRGRPKGVVHTHGSALFATASGLDARCVGHGERLYLPMPFFWTGGFGPGVLSALLAGATLLTEAEPEPGRTIRFLERTGATLFRGWPDQAERLAAHPSFAGADLSRLGPGSLPAILPDDVRPAPGARANVFGMTETLGPYCGARLDVDLPVGKEGSCGQPFDGVDVRIVDPDSGAVRGPGEDGEIRVRGRGLLRTICGRSRADVFDRDGFYPTGDLGTLDADGYLWYRGRRDDMFKVSGASVYPVEVETALRSLPGVSEAHVTDHLDDDVRRVAAVVVTRLDPGTLADGVRQRLSAFKVPTRWVVLDDPADVPRLASGKVDLDALRGLIVTASVRA